MTQETKDRLSAPQRDDRPAGSPEVGLLLDRRPEPAPLCEAGLVLALRRVLREEMAAARRRYEATR